MDIHREVADKYQGLFNLMSKEHNLILTINEMDEIIIEAQKVVNKISSKLVLCGDSEQFYCWDEEALGKGSRCKVECNICKNKGQQ